MKKVAGIWYFSSSSRILPTPTRAPYSPRDSGDGVFILNVSNHKDSASKSKDRHTATFLSSAHMNLFSPFYEVTTEQAGTNVRRGHYKQGTTPSQTVSTGERELACLSQCGRRFPGAGLPVPGGHVPYRR